MPDSDGLKATVSDGGSEDPVNRGVEPHQDVSSQGVPNADVNRVTAINKRTDKR